MLRIVVGGQIDKEALATLIRSLGGDQVQVTVKSDIEAAMAIKTGQADYYFGACHTGGGGALAMAIALLGFANCATVSMPGKMKSEEEILAEIAKGKKAFGFTPQHMEPVVKLIMGELLAK